MLTPSKNWGPDLPALCGTILKACIHEEDKYQVGLTKIFFRAGMLAYMEKLRTDRVNYLVTLMQKNFLRHMHVKRYQNLRRATIGVQSVWRKKLAQRRAEQIRQEEAAVTIQRFSRGFICRQRFLQTRYAIVQIQSRKCPFLNERCFREKRSSRDENFNSRAISAFSLYV
jgi:myosin-5